MEALNGLDTAPVGEATASSARAGKSIEVRGLHKTYETRHGPVEAVRNVSLDLREGEFVSLVGPSGCGKSTILHITAGLVEYEAGDVQVAGTGAKAGRRDVGIMLQKPVLLPWRSVVANVLMPAEIYGLDKAGSRVRARELLGLMGLGGFEDKHPWELSGGMQQRASLARLLLPDPAILLMDEPFAALDEFTRERLNGELARLHEKLGRSVLYVTHNIPEAVFLSDRVVVLKARPGEVLQTVDIDLPRPRSLDLINDPHTAELSARIRALLSATMDDLTEHGPNEEDEGG